MKTTLFALAMLISMVSAAQKFSLGVGYMKGLAGNAEITINKERDELRLFGYKDSYYPIINMDILYQPYIEPLVWQLRPVVAVGPSVGFWTNRRRSFWPDDSGNYSPNSPWKKNPVIGLAGLAGLEYGTKKASVELAGSYWLSINNSFWGTFGIVLTTKINL